MCQLLFIVRYVFIIKRRPPRIRDESFTAAARARASPSCRRPRWPARPPRCRRSSSAAVAPTPSTSPPPLRERTRPDLTASRCCCRHRRWTQPPRSGANVLEHFAGMGMHPSSTMKATYSHRSTGFKTFHAGSIQLRLIPGSAFFFLSAEEETTVSDWLQLTRFPTA